jgi:hypothetical protein
VLAIPAPWQLPTLNVAAWADAAWAWEQDDGSFYVPVSGDEVDSGGFGSSGGGWQERHLGSAGFGVFLGGGYFPAIRWDFAWRTSDFKTFTDKPRTRFWIGFNF